MRSTLYQVREPKAIPEMTWQEVQEALESGTDTIVMGVGALEQHGPHLPIGTDNFHVDEIVRRTVARLAERNYRALAGPVVPFGFSAYHMSCPGTITLSTRTLQALVTEVCQSLYRHGFRKFALVLGHGGNFGAMIDASQELVAATDAQAIVLNWVPAVRSRYDEILGEATRDGHGGQGETARALALQPKLVHMDKVVVPRSLGRELTRLPDVPYAASIIVGGGLARPVKDYRKATDDVGIIGDPRPATAEKGEALFEAAADWLERVIVACWG